MVSGKHLFCWAVIRSSTKYGQKELHWLNAFFSFNMEDEITIIKSKLFQQKRNYMVLLSVLLGRKWIKQLATTQLHKVQPIGKTIYIFF